MLLIYHHTPIMITVKFILSYFSWYKLYIVRNHFDLSKCTDINFYMYFLLYSYDYENNSTPQSFINHYKIYIIKTTFKFQFWCFAKV